MYIGRTQKLKFLAVVFVFLACVVQFTGGFLNRVERKNGNVVKNVVLSVVLLYCLFCLLSHEMIALHFTFCLLDGLTGIYNLLSYCFTRSSQSS